MRAKAKVLSDINYLGLVAVIRTDSADQVLPLCEALVKGGVNALEITMTVPDAVNVMKNVVKQFGNVALVGMGSVLDAKTTQMVFDSGADFVVSPITKVEVAATSRKLGRVSMIGAYTPTEAQLAHDSGADFVKIFPADNLGPSYMRALRAPMPHLKLVPTGGVTLENVADFINAGVAAVGVGSSLITKQILKDSNWAELTRLAGDYSKAVRAAKDKK